MNQPYHGQPQQGWQAPAQGAPQGWNQPQQQPPQQQYQQPHGQPYPQQGYPQQGPPQGQGHPQGGPHGQPYQQPGYQQYAQQPPPAAAAEQSSSRDWNSYSVPKASAVANAENKIEDPLGWQGIDWRSVRYSNGKADDEAPLPVGTWAALTSYVEFKDDVDRDGNLLDTPVLKVDVFMVTAAGPRKVGLWLRPRHEARWASFVKGVAPELVDNDMPRGPWWAKGRLFYAVVAYGSGKRAHDGETPQLDIQRFLPWSPEGPPQAAPTNGRGRQPAQAQQGGGRQQGYPQQQQQQQQQGYPQQGGYPQGGPQQGYPQGGPQQGGWQAPPQQQQWAPPPQPPTQPGRLYGQGPPQGGPQYGGPPQGGQQYGQSQASEIMGVPEAELPF